MKKKINYNDIFSNAKISIPKRIKGDIYSLREINIQKNKLFNPNNLIVQSRNMNKLNKSYIQKYMDKSKSNYNDNTEDISTTLPIAATQQYKYVICTQPNNLIYIPNHNKYYTNDKDLKQLVDLMNESPTKEFGYSNVIDENKCKVYKKIVDGIQVILIKCLAKIPYNKDVVFEAIANLNIRKQWDSVFSELRVVNYNGENGAEILYMIIKSPVFIVSDREFVQQRKIWRNFPTSKSHMLHFISVDSPECPENKKCVRAETIVSGYFIEDDPDEPGHSIIGVLSQTDVKGNLPIFLVNKFAPKSSKNWIKSLHKGCKIVLANNHQ